MHVINKHVYSYQHARVKLAEYFPTALLSNCSYSQACRYGLLHTRNIDTVGTKYCWHMSMCLMSLSLCVRAPLFVCEYFNMNEGIKFEIREIVHRETQRLLQAGNEAQLHWEISAFSRDLCTSTQCCFASTVFSILAVTALLRPYWRWMVKVHCQTAQYYMTRLLPCKHKIPLFGCPCHSHALLKPCELQI